MKIIKVWSIYTLSAGGSHALKYYVSNKEAAHAWKAEHLSDEFIEKQFVVYDTFEELQDIASSELRKTALAKLTPAEKKALGFTE